MSKVWDHFQPGPLNIRCKSVTCVDTMKLWKPINRKKVFICVGSCTQKCPHLSRWTERNIWLKMKFIQFPYQPKCTWSAKTCLVPQVCFTGATQVMMLTKNTKTKRLREMEDTSVYFNTEKFEDTKCSLSCYQEVLRVLCPEDTPLTKKKKSTDNQ